MHFVLSSNGWLSEIEMLASRIKKYRNPAIGYMKKLDEQRIFTIELNHGARDTSRYIKNELISLFDYIEYNHKHIPYCAMELFGRGKPHPDNITQMMLPSKLIITDTLYFVLEINFPTRNFGIGYSMEHFTYPEELNSLFELFDPRKGRAILLTFNPIDDIEAMISAFRQCEGGDKLQFPGYIDVLSLWVHLGSWTLNTDLHFMFRLIVGGTLVYLKTQNDRENFLDPYVGLRDWKRCYITSYCKAIISLFEAFFVIHIERILPEKELVTEAWNQPPVRIILERLVSVVAEAIAYVNFDQEAYDETIPFNKYRCVQPIYEGESLIRRAWSEYCNYKKSHLLHYLEQIWPWQRPIITRLGWRENQPTDTRVIELLFHESSWYSIYPPTWRNKECSDTQPCNELQETDQYISEDQMTRQPMKQLETTVNTKNYMRFAPGTISSTGYWR